MPIGNASLSASGKWSGPAAAVSSTSVAEVLPVLYSFRRCPYAMRARLALAAAGLQPGRDLELREVALKAKPPELLEASAKSTVPVLVLPDGIVLEQSLVIMGWALEQADPHGWLAGWDGAAQAQMQAWIAENDGPFKHHLDRFKYPERFGDAGLAERPSHRAAALAILRGWQEQLAGGGWLLGDCPCLADWALLPFVRQFRLADPEGFDAAEHLVPLQAWLGRFLASPELAAVMAEPWTDRSPWRSPGWLYHLALRPEWTSARLDGVYARSTRGRSLEEVGFIHLSAAHQLAATAARFYADVPAGELLLLTIDPQGLAAAGLPVRQEPAPGSGELFPHLYGALPLQAVLLAQPFSP
jgi:glutathione S-transferase